MGKMRVHRYCYYHRRNASVSRATDVQHPNSAYSSNGKTLNYRSKVAISFVFPGEVWHNPLRRDQGLRSRFRYRGNGPEHLTGSPWWRWTCDAAGRSNLLHRSRRSRSIVRIERNKGGKSLCSGCVGLGSRRGLRWCRCF